MKIWILTKKKKFRHYENRRFMEEAKKLGLDVKLVSPADIDILEPMSDSSKFLYRGKLSSPPDCLIPRLGSGATYFGLSVIRLFERLGVFVLNTNASTEDARDKFRTTQILSAKNLPIPKTLLAKTPLKASLIKKEFKFPVVLKSNIGTFGSGVMLCENQNQVEDVISLLRTSSGVSHPADMIVQEFVSSSRGKDIRVIVIGGRAIGAMLRQAQKETQFKANVAQGGKGGFFELNPEIEWLAVESTRALGLEVAGVDILFDKGSYKVCEVNSSPYFKGFEASTGVNVPGEFYRFISVHLGGK